MQRLLEDHSRQTRRERLEELDLGSAAVPNGTERDVGGLQMETQVGDEPSADHVAAPLGSGHVAEHKEGDVLELGSKLADRLQAVAVGGHVGAGEDDRGPVGQAQLSLGGAPRRRVRGHVEIGISAVGNHRNPRWVHVVCGHEEIPVGLADGNDQIRASNRMCLCPRDVPDPG